MTPEQKYNELFVKYAYKKSADIKKGSIEAMMRQYRRKLKNDT